MSADGFRFPLDMEREIFETAAAVNPQTIPTLLRVCHRIHAWLEPLLYMVVIATKDDDPVFNAVRHKSPAFLQNAVRHVFLASDAIEAATKHLLPNSSGITSLFLDAEVDLSLFDVLANTRVRRLNLSVPPSPHDQWAQSILKQPMFLSISHLDLYKDNSTHSNWDDWSLLASLPALTHLCFSKTLSVLILNNVLAECPRLRAVITAFWAEGEEDKALLFAGGLATNDPRAVVMAPSEYKEDWERGIRGGEDFWVRAEIFVAKKRAREIQKDQYFLPDSLLC
ncbi:hypothetical protein C8F04DRAFT_1171182 [Mycena alexandri]|uniref:Uncharacterized protein n=1 Tax=Mycena alexandri TaxID=1745969 RepID=A0AAD6WLP8_9AGAR|nr:hypothetical protein C8F04DRAFT_1171182 [Mycena alexandri]